MQKTAFRQNFSWKRSPSSEPREDSLALSPVQPKPLPLFVQLRDYQKKAVAFALSQKGVGLFCDPRTGKTWIALAVVEQLQPQNVLAVVPLTNKQTTWAKWAGKLLPNYTICLTLEEFRSAPKPRMLLAHYEWLPRIIKKLVRVPWNLVILDESQRIKARASRQSRNLRRLRHADRRLALSGTPMDDSEIDLWGQMRFIEPRALSERWSDFDHEFLKPDGYMGYGRKFRKEKSEEFNARIKPFCLRVTRDEAGIPEPTMIWCPVMLLGDQRRLYERLERDWIMTINGAKIKTTIELTKRAKLQQLVNGFVFDDDGTAHPVGEAKLRKLRYLLKRRLEPPVIIFCQYLPEVLMIEEACRELSDNVATLTGAIKDKRGKRDRSNLIEAFQSGSIDYLICQQKTGGVGIDLYRSRNAIFYSFGHSYIDFDQAKSRMDVAGENAPIIFLIYASYTIDEDKREAVLFKRSITEVVLNRLKQLGAPKMSKTEKNAKAPAQAEAKKSNLPPKPSYKYGVPELANTLGIEPASVRIALRKAKIDKSEGGVYGWNTKADFDAVLSQLKPKGEGKKKAA